MEYVVTAFNRAANHQNRIHDPELARSFGFRGGLVPGVDVFAYMAHPVCAAWGLEWVRHGLMEARFSRPVYDGDRLTVVAAPAGERLELQVVNAAGDICAAGAAGPGPDEPPPDPAGWPEEPLPEPPPPATREAFEARPVLGSTTVTIGEAEARAQLAEVRETLPIFEEQRVVHPGHLLRLADSVLAANVSLPPWMHVSSRALFFGTAGWGDRLSVRARVTALFEKKGHRFVQLDVLAIRGTEPVMRVAPYTAIYRPTFVG